MNRKLILAACILGVTSVILGAFGAHALKEILTVESQRTFETGVRYQMYHALFLLFIGANNVITPKTKNSILYLIIVGVVLFSGSIYGLSTNSLTSFDFKTIGFVTPIGGLLLIVAWMLSIMDLLKNRPKNDQKQ